MAIFTQHTLPEQIVQEMGSVANGIALCIEGKRSEQALDASEVKYRSVVENIKEIIFQMDEFANWTFLNPAWTAVTGFEVKSTLGTFFLEYIHEEDRQHNRHIFLQLINRTLDYCRYETRFLTNNGKTRWVEVYLQLTLNNDRTILGISGSLTDITERKLAETAIQKLAAFPQVNPNPGTGIRRRWDIVLCQRFSPGHGKIPWPRQSLVHPAAPHRVHRPRVFDYGAKEVP